MTSHNVHEERYQGEFENQAGQDFHDEQVQRDVAGQNFHEEHVRDSLTTSFQQDP